METATVIVHSFVSSVSSVLFGAEPVPEPLPWYLEWWVFFGLYSSRIIWQVALVPKVQAAPHACSQQHATDRGLNCARYLPCTPLLSALATLCVAVDAAHAAHLLCRVRTLRALSGDLACDGSGTHDLPHSPVGPAPSRRSLQPSSGVAVGLRCGSAPPPFGTVLPPLRAEPCTAAAPPGTHHPAGADCVGGSPRPRDRPGGSRSECELLGARLRAQTAHARACLLRAIHNAHVRRHDRGADRRAAQLARCSSMLQTPSRWRHSFTL